MSRDLQARRQWRVLPRLEVAAAGSDVAFESVEPSRFITPAPDARLFPGFHLPETMDRTVLARPMVMIHGGQPP